MKRKARETVTYVIWRGEDTAQEVVEMTVPASWTVTYGPMLGAPRKFKPSGEQTLPATLRFYEGKMQRACLLGVTQFCDKSIDIKPSALYEGMKKLSGEMPQHPIAAF